MTDISSSESCGRIVRKSNQICSSCTRTMIGTGCDLNHSCKSFADHSGCDNTSAADSIGSSGKAPPPVRDSVLRSSHIQHRFVWKF